VKAWQLKFIHVVCSNKELMMLLKKQFGFSLVELSVTLAVIGVTLAGALTLATKKTEADKLTETQTKMAAIDAALDVYLTTNQRLPCPADGSLAMSNSNFGIAGTATNTGCTTLSNFNSTPALAYAGVVPVRTLLLPDSTMIDGWGRRITYIIDFNFANNSVVAGGVQTNTVCDGVTASGATHTACFKYKSAGGLTVNDSTGAARTTTAVYVLISHGKNGRGAYTYAGSFTRLAASADDDEKSNAGSDATGGFDKIFVQKDTTTTPTTFDDIVTYRSKAEIMDDALTMTDSDICSFAIDTATNCTGEPSPALKCTAFSTKISTLCLDMSL
jgi:prepilin-type N-terminal cleavage/methylation domain-containing protein